MEGKKRKNLYFDTGPESMEFFKKHKIKLISDPRKRGPKKYSKTDRKLILNEGYDVLENLSVVRLYIQRKYEISFKLLEIILYLYPRNYFTWGEYYEFPKHFQYNRMRKMIEDGIISIAVEGKGERSRLYCLSRKHRSIVTNFYAYLFGEKKIPTKQTALNRIGSSEMDRRRHKLIQKLNGIPPSDTKKRFFE